MTAVATGDEAAEAAEDTRPASRPASWARAGMFARFPPRPVPRRWPATDGDRAALLALLPAPGPGAPRAQRQPANARRRGLSLMVGWLEDHPGHSWQERWLATGAEAAGQGWADGPAAWLARRGQLSRPRLELMTSSLALLIGADVLRPSLHWLLVGGKKRKLARHIVARRDPEGFEHLRAACNQDAAIGREACSHIAFRCAMVMAAKGGGLADITVGDVLEVLDTEIVLRGRAASISPTFKMLRQMGVFSPDVPSVRELRSVGQRSVEELVDRYPVRCREIRDLLVEYLKERQPAVDYTTLRNQSAVLAGRFWVDIERHHPGIDTLALPAAVATAWKQRLRTKTTTVNTSDGVVERSGERLSYLDELATVRAFYLDLSEWALEDPGRWARWAVACPIRPEELSRRKQVRQRKARMDARTRQRLPALPALVAAARRRHREAEALLAAGRDAAPGEPFSAAGRTMVRSVRPHAMTANVWAQDPTTDKAVLLNREEDHAFWACAVIDVLRLTGIRVEELLELSHHGLVQYRLPSSGELVPLLQVAPSKTDAERLLVVSPDLADVLSAVISRVRDDSGAVPLVRARDYHEHVWLDASPLLFQRRLGLEHHAFSVGLVGTLLDEALSHAGLVDHADGSPLRYSPHDFRRMFITDAVMNGLPPHIAQVLAGHKDLNVTMGYKAVYPEEAVHAHLAFLARRRALRPSEEYRTPTDDEWQEFLGHFERRKVSIGTCARAFGTPCIHEHACVRCPLLWPDPAQRARLVDIRDNLASRIDEARREGWLGEVEGLRVSLAGATDKLAQIDHRNGGQPVEITDNPSQRQARAS